MKIEFPLLATLLLIGISLLTRVQAQGVEQALVSTAIEYAMNGIKVTLKLFPRTVKLAW